jgi:hypothetical protein
MMLISLIQEIHQETKKDIIVLCDFWRMPDVDKKRRKVG